MTPGKQPFADLHPVFVKYEEVEAGSGHGRNNPDFPGGIQWGGFPVHSWHDVPTLAEADGIKFRCPCGGHKNIIWFAGRGAPPDVGQDSAGHTVRWEIAGGSGLADLQLSPSIHVLQPCGWHGFIGTDGAAPGEVITL